MKENTRSEAARRDAVWNRRVQLLKEAAHKSVGAYGHIEVHLDRPAEQGQFPDEDGDWVMGGSSYELYDSVAGGTLGVVRVQWPVGTTQAGVVRALKKALSWIEERPDILAWGCDLTETTSVADWLPYSEDDGRVLVPHLHIRPGVVELDGLPYAASALPALEAAADAERRQLLKHASSEEVVF